MFLWSRSWVIWCIEFVPKTTTFIMLDTYDYFCLWRRFRWMIKFLWKRTLKPFLGNDLNGKEFANMLSLIQKTNFRWLPQHWSSNCKQREEWDFSGHWDNINRLFYNQNARQSITEREFEILHNTPWTVHPANYPTEVDPDDPHPGWKGYKESDCDTSCDWMSSGGIADDE